MRILATIEEYRSEHQDFLDEGVKILELAQSAHSLYLRQDPKEKRQMLSFLLSNSTWKNGELTATFRKPFDALVVTNALAAEQEAVGVGYDDERSVWRPLVDTFRTLITPPGPRLALALHLAAP